MHNFQIDVLLNRGLFTTLMIIGLLVASSTFFFKSKESDHTTKIIKFVLIAFGIAMVFPMLIVKPLLVLSSGLYIYAVVIMCRANIYLANAYRHFSVSRDAKIGMVAFSVICSILLAIMSDLPIYLLYRHSYIFHPGLISKSVIVIELIAIVFAHCALYWYKVIIDEYKAAEFNDEIFEHLIPNITLGDFIPDLFFPDIGFMDFGVDAGEAMVVIFLIFLVVILAIVLLPIIGTFFLAFFCGLLPLYCFFYSKKKEETVEQNTHGEVKL